MSELENTGREGVLSPVSSASSKKSKSSKDIRVFERLSVSSVQYFAESLGYDTHYRKFCTILSSDALCALTEDVNYRIRELAHKAALFMRQRRGEQLSVGDLNEALRWSGAAVLCGHRSREPPRLHFLKDANIFVPNDGMVDATALALAKPSRIPVSTPVLTGHYFTNASGSIDSGEPAERDESTAKDDVLHFNRACSRLLQLCSSCKLEDFKEHLTALGRIVSDKPECGLVLLTQLKHMITQPSCSSRMWYCLRETLRKSDLSKSADGLNLVCQLAELLKNSILSISPLPESCSIELQCLIMASLETRYDFLSSVSNFLPELVQQLEKINSLSSHHASRVLAALFWTVDSQQLLSHIDVIISQFRFYVIGENFNDPNLHYSWKTLIASILRVCSRDLLIRPSSMDALIWTLLPLANEAYGDGLEAFLVDSGVTVSYEVEEKAVEEKAKSGNEFLEEHWNSLTRKVSGRDSEAGIIEINLPKASGKRKRRREASDIFAYPKRLRLSHQRDIIFVFHHTQATVRPVPAQRMVSEKWTSGTIGPDMNERITRIYNLVKRKHKRSRFPLPLSIDIRTLTI